MHRRLLPAAVAAAALLAGCAGSPGAPAASGSRAGAPPTGLRNAEGLAEVPGTGALWAVVNNRDQIAYPRHGDITGDGRDDYGTVVPSYVDDHPMEPFVHVEQDRFYGWPFCNATQDTAAGNRSMPFERDAETNADGHVDCAAAERIDVGIQAHSAPLGLTFLQRTAVPAQLRTGAAVALHGSWNRTRRTGYKVVWFGWRASSAAASRAPSRTWLPVGSAPTARTSGAGRSTWPPTRTARCSSPTTSPAPSTA
jgi:hypothetical protein